MNDNASGIRKGQVIKLDGEYYTVLDTQLITPGNWRAMVQMKIRSLKSGNSAQKRFRSTEMIEYVHTEKRAAEYLYADASGHVFMENDTYEQITLQKDLIEDALPFMPPNAQVHVCYLDGSPTGVELPASVILEVKDTEPAIKGDTATNVTKKATLETGAEVKVPLHINAGDNIKIDTRTGDFLGRSN